MNDEYNFAGRDIERRRGPFVDGQRNAAVVGSDLQTELVTGIDFGFGAPQRREQACSDIKDCDLHNVSLAVSHRGRSSDDVICEKPANPTNAVGGLFIFDLHQSRPERFGISFVSLGPGGAGAERERKHEGKSAVYACRMNMNDPPTALVGLIM